MKNTAVLAVLLILCADSTGQPSPGDKLKDSLNQALAHAKDDTTRIKTLYALGNIYAADDSATAAKYANDGRKLSDRQKFTKGLGLYYLLMAKIHRNASDNLACLQDARQAYLIFSKTEENKSTAAAHG